MCFTSSTFPPAGIANKSLKSRILEGFPSSWCGCTCSTHTLCPHQLTRTQLTHCSGLSRVVFEPSGEQFPAWLRSYPRPTACPGGSLAVATPSWKVQCRGAPAASQCQVGMVPGTMDLLPQSSAAACCPQHKMNDVLVWKTNTQLF